MSATERSGSQEAVLYRMALPEHVCPFGVKAKQLLIDHGYEVEDHLLRSREAVEAFKQEHGVDTTPLVFLGGERIGGSDALERHFRAAEPSLSARDPQSGA